MFGIGFVEICIIALVAVVFVGPKKLPELMKHVGKFFVQVRKMSNEVKSSFDNVVREAEQEIHLENLRKIKEMTKGNISKTLNELNGPQVEHIDNHQHNGENEEAKQPQSQSSNSPEGSETIDVSELNSSTHSNDFHTDNEANQASTSTTSEKNSTT
ncbi:MAG: Sec-independent protein translocase protein TatB [Bdellovibrionota bacterium]